VVLEVKVAQVALEVKVAMQDGQQVEALVAQVA